MGAPAASILRALFARCATLNVGSPTLTIAWPEAADQFDPPASGKFLAVAVFPNRPGWEGLTSGKQDQGVLQVTVVWPKNGGVVAPAVIADQIIAHFPKGLAMQSGTAKVRVSAEAWAAQPIIEPDRVSVPVTISWTA